MQRPSGVTITAILMAFNLFADVGLSLISPSVVSPDARANGPAFSPAMVAMHVVLVAFIVVQLATVFYFWLGRSWARWMVLVGCIFYLTGLKDLATQWHHSYAGVALTVGSSLLALYLIWYLYTSEVRTWFARSSSTATARSAMTATER